MFQIQSLSAERLQPADPPHVDRAGVRAQMPGPLQHGVLHAAAMAPRTTLLLHCPTFTFLQKPRTEYGQKSILK